MTTAYLLPCGISILRALRDNDASYPVTDARQAFLRAEEQWRVDLRDLPEDRLVAAWAETLAEDAKDAAIAEADPARICAETQTLRTRTGLAPRQLLDRGDRIVLLASDTANGTGAALCTAFIMTEGDPDKIGYVSTPPPEDVEDFPDALPAGRVTIVRITGLRPKATDIGTAVAAIGRVMYAAHLLGGPLEVHLTGGYKVTLLHTMAMTEILYSKAPDRVTAWYIEEAENEPIEIGLRCFSPGLLRDMREELTHAWKGQPPGGPRTFQGQLWRPQGEGTKLTDFGDGFLAVLGGPAISAA